MASSNCRLSNGLVRNSNAPAFIARTDIGMSPRPVMNTIGNSRPSSVKLRLQLEPAEVRQVNIKHQAVGILQSIGTQTLRRGSKRLHVKASRANQPRQGHTDCHVVVDDEDLRRPLRSYSLTRYSRKCEANSRSNIRFARRPQPTAACFDDAAANRQTHAHAVRFRREERVEDPIAMLRIDARTRIDHGDLDLRSIVTVELIVTVRGRSLISDIASVALVIEID